MYAYQVNYEKVFKSGILAGKRYHDYLRFCSHTSAKQFAAKCDGITLITACAGSSTYTMEYPNIVPLETTSKARN